MDENPKCNQVTELTLKKEQSIDPHDEPVCSKDELTTIKVETVLKKVQSVCLREQAACSKDQPSYPITQNDFLPTSKEQATTAQIQIGPYKDDVCLSTEPTNQSKMYIPLIREPPASPNNQIVVSMATSSSLSANEEQAFCVARGNLAAISYNSYLGAYPPLKIISSTQNPVITSQPLSSRLQGVAVSDQPQTLFLQALAKLNDSSLALSVLSHLKLLQSTNNLGKVFNFDESGDITPPDSLTSAPPSYSFVLRQMAVRRRPRFMGTFIPSPSFVQHTPPPTYATAFDVYIEPALPPPPTRVYTFGFTSMPMACPECGYTGMTVVTSRVTICTHLCAFVLCLLCCWICAPLPYILRSCKDVYHYCRNCRSFLGMYCPTNPENVYSSG